MKDLWGRRALVVGLGRSGREAARVLSERGAIVTVTDTRPPSEFQDALPELLARKAGLELGRHEEKTFLDHELIVVSPGVPWDMPHLAAARAKGIEVVTEVEFASRLVEGTLIGVTGSNGKTTTTALLGRMLEASGFPTFVGGNIGVPLVSAVGRTSRDTMLVCELSSFQLEAIDTLRPHIAVVLNITPNHLDRHPSFEAYAAAKARIFKNQTEDDFAVLNADDAGVVKLAEFARSRKVCFARQRELAEGVFAAGGEVLYRTRHLERTLLAARDVRLRGAFNLENVLAAATSACLVGAEFDAIRRVASEFEGVEHRLEFVREIQGVQFFNDSKATSVDATAKALSAFDRGVHLILGGKDKGAPYAPLVPLLKDRVSEALLIGAAAERIEKELEGTVELARAGDLERAVRLAFERAEPGDVVLLAPACASFDQFRDFEHRGRVFKELVQRLAVEAESMPLRQKLQAVAVESAVPAEPAEVEEGPPAPVVPQVEPEPVESETSEPEPAPAPSPVEANEPGQATSDAVTTDQAEPAPPTTDAITTEEAEPAPRELTYVYEVGADELPAMDFDLPPDDTGTVENEHLPPAQTAKDEALMFEVRSDSDPANRPSEEPPVPSEPRLTDGKGEH